MSYTQHYKGTMTKLYGSYMSLEEQLVTEMDKYGLEYNGDTEDALEDLREEEDYSIRGNSLYKIITEEVHPDWDIGTATRISEDTIAFEVRYYNGGCDFYEALETALEKL